MSIPIELFEVARTLTYTSTGGAVVGIGTSVEILAGVNLHGSLTDSTGYVGTPGDILTSPQASFTITSIIGSVGVSKTFVTNSGVGAGITHTYVSGGLVAPLQMEFICSILENSLV